MIQQTMGVVLVGGDWKWWARAMAEKFDKEGGIHVRKQKENCAKVARNGGGGAAEALLGVGSAVA